MEKLPPKTREQYKQNLDETLLIENYTRFIHKIIWSIEDHGECDHEELLQVGYEGFVKALRDFDESKGFLFYTFVRSRVYYKIRHFIRDNRLFKNRRDSGYFFYDSLNTPIKNSGKEQIDILQAPDLTNIFTIVDDFNFNFSQKQKTIVALLLQGYTKVEVAQYMNLSLSTVYKNFRQIKLIIKDNKNNSSLP